MDLKDLVLEHAPLWALNVALPGLFGQRTPFIPPILEREVIFIHVPKAAGSSLKTELYGAPVGGHRRIAEFAAFDQKKTRDFFKFAFVRNPWDRFLSAYSYLVQGEGTTGRDNRFANAYLSPKGSFEGFVSALNQHEFRKKVLRYDHFKPQYHWICMPKAQTHALDFLGRYETLAADMELLRRRLSLTPSRLDQTRASNHVPYTQAYTDQSRKIVAHLYQKDIEMFGYAFGN